MEKMNLTKKTIGLVVAVVIGVFAAGMDVARATQPPDSITVDEALSIALKDDGKSAEEVTVTKQRPDVEDGIQTYDIEFFYFEGESSVTEYDYEIEAATGRILERSRETEYVTRTPEKGMTPHPSAAPTPSPQGEGTKQEAPVQQQPAQPEAPAQQKPAQQSQQYIGIEQAKEIALAHAGVGADVWFEKEKQDFENGRVVYEFEFHAGPVEYEYEIDAVTGNIWDYDIDYD